VGGLIRICLQKVTIWQDWAIPGRIRPRLPNFDRRAKFHPIENM